MAKISDKKGPASANVTDGKMNKIISLCKRRGIIFQASEIYGGFANAYDFGPLGAQIKKNIKDLWWKRFVTQRTDIVGLDSAIIQNPKVWEASGHLKSFSDPLVECKKCHKRFRADHIAELKSETRNRAKGLLSGKSETNFNDKNSNIKNLSQEQREFIYCKGAEEHDFADAKEFNLMFKTFIGPTEDTNSVAYLRPETAQGIFTNFSNVVSSSRVKIPFGIAQIGKAFRNEITPGNFIFRTREFEQAEIEFFAEPSKEESQNWYQAWIGEVEKFYLEVGVGKGNLSWREHKKEELAHYSIGTTDVEYEFPFGVSELAGIAQRTDYDLKAHNIQYFDEESGKRFTPYVIEPSLGIERALLAILCEAYCESDGSDGREKGEIVLRLKPMIAPIKVAVLPLVKKEGLTKIARDIECQLKAAGIEVYYDESGSVGRRYRRQDEIGTPWCITVDFDSLEDKKVTIRDRDTMKQERISVSSIVKFVSDKFK